MHPVTKNQRSAVTNLPFREATPEQLRAASAAAGGGALGTKAAQALAAQGLQLREAEIVLSSKATSQDRRHEFGHIDQALRSPEAAIRDADEADKSRTETEYRKSASEKYADQFAEDASKNEPEPPKD